MYNALVLMEMLKEKETSSICKGSITYMGEFLGA